MQISQDEYNKTHKTTIKNNQSVGIDLGLNSFVSLSNGLQIKAPKPLILVKRARQLSKKQLATASRSK